MQYMIRVLNDHELFGPFFVTRTLEITDALLDDIAEFVEQHAPDQTARQLLNTLSSEVIIEFIYAAVRRWESGKRGQGVFQDKISLPTAEDDEPHSSKTEISEDADNAATDEPAPTLEVVYVMVITLNHHGFDFAIYGYAVTEREQALDDYFTRLRETYRRDYSFMQPGDTAPEKPVLN